MRIPNSEHESRPWRIREVVPDFTLEDVWALPAHGGAGDFDVLLANAVTSDPAEGGFSATRALWLLRDLLGRVFGLGRIAAPEHGSKALPIPGTSETTLADRLPEDLRGTAAGMRFGSLPFKPLYRTADEFAAELSNETVHGVMHQAWADEGGGRFGGQMAVYVKPRGAFGKGYMALIKPFRYWIVYPALMRRIERQWTRRVPG